MERLDNFRERNDEPLIACPEVAVENHASGFREAELDVDRPAARQKFGWPRINRLPLRGSFSGNGRAGRPNDASRPRGWDVCRPARLRNERCWLSLSKRDATFALSPRTYIPSGKRQNTRQISSNGHDGALKLGGMNSKRKPPPYARRSPTSRRSPGRPDAPSRSQRDR